MVSRRPAVIYYIRAVIDFVIIAHYRTHDEEIIRYIIYILYRIDKLKTVFKIYWPVDKNTNEGYFNFPKFYAVIYYPEFIRKFKYIDKYNSSYSEAAYKILIKIFYLKTNKREGYLEVIRFYNIRRANISNDK